MMTEYGYVEKPILEWLAGKPTDPADRGLGWRFRTEAEMAQVNPPLENPLVEGLLLPALFQLHRYQREAPALLTANVFAVAADEQEFRYGPVAFQVGSQRDVDLQRDHWRPWLSQYPRRRGYWNLPDDQLDPDPVKAAVDGLLLPCNVLDFLQHFTVFETKKGKTVKKVARYQQFEAANELVDRVLDL